MDDTAAHIEAAAAAARTLPRDPGSPAETILANLARIRRDVAQISARAEAHDTLKATANDLAQQLGHARSSHEAQHQALADELTQARAHIAEIRQQQNEKLGQAGAVIHQYKLVLDALATDLLKLT